MRFFILTAGLLLAEAALADSPRRPFPHGQEDHAPPDDEAAEGADSPEQNQTAGPTPADERACTLHFPTWAKRQAAPETHPDRAQSYHFQAQLMAKMLALTEEWPGLIEAQCIGRSVRRDPVWSFTIENPTRPVEFTVLVFAQLHALEWLGPEVSLRLAESLTNSAPEGVRVVLVPIANPDGRARVERDLINERIGIYRRANANGVDLNRDWAVNREIHSVWSKLPFTGRYYYTSDAPLSQPESRNLDRLAAEIQPDAVVSLHSFGGYVYYPWGGLSEAAPDNQELHRLAEVMSSAQSNGGYIAVQLGKWASWFKAHGVEIDHFYGTYGAASFIIELSHSGIQLFDWSTVRDYFRWYNPRDPEPHIQDGFRAVRGLIYDYASRTQSAPSSPHRDTKAPN